MAIVSLYTNCGVNLADSDWTADFLAMIAASEAADGYKYSYAKKESEWTKWKVGKSGIDFPIVVTADGITLISSLLAGINVASISMDGQVRYAGVDFYKGNPGDNAATQKASNTITLTNGSFYNGQTVLIIPGA